RVMALVASPCAVGLAVLSRPIYALLAKHTPESLNIATPLLAVLGICAFFNAVVLVSNSIMQSHGDVTIPVTNMLIGGIIKIIVSFVLVGNPEINILGAAIGTVICYGAISVLNLLSMAKRKYPVNLMHTVFKPLLAALVMGAGAFLTRMLLERMGLANVLVTGGSIAVGAVLYVILVLLLKVITKEDCALLPKGDKVAKLLHIS
ncbi:MAG: polysaccharide biosynthesis C-terminal domain-containing protein, partial [Oscillospiraceae bacterium]|nr:polysaccharide biosynthesis C-terminal domain-containing protein [Oscillospiraceae bacterium]